MSRRCATGAARIVALVADDNGSLLQRSLMLLFELRA